MEKNIYIVENGCGEVERQPWPKSVYNVLQPGTSTEAMVYV